MEFAVGALDGGERTNGQYPVGKATEEVIAFRVEGEVGD